MWRIVSMLVFVVILTTPAPVSNQGNPTKFEPWVAKDAPVPLQWYCLDPAPHAPVERTEYCDSGWHNGRCGMAVTTINYDPDSPARICGWFTFLSTLESP